MLYDICKQILLRMNKLFFIPLFAGLSFSSCKNAVKKQDEKEMTALQYFGDSITENGSISSELLSSKMKNKDSLNIKLSGKIIEVCQKKGMLDGSEHWGQQKNEG